jgi:hypothetical protein
MDVDLVEYPPDVLRRLLATGKDIVQPHCVKQFGGKTFDCNAWKDHGRLHMDVMRSWGDLVELDCVGGAMLLIRADLHREGLVFPPAYYGRPHPKSRRTGAGDCSWVQRRLEAIISGEIETEGLGLMASDMGVACWGMPNLEVRHKDE